jgi:hypothetical protein
MSNHDGSYMLNEILHGLVEMGILNDMSGAQKKSIRDLLWGVCIDHDCNWGEIIDIEVAVLLETCACCGSGSKKISADSGYCARCNQNG